MAEGHAVHGMAARLGQLAGAEVRSRSSAAFDGARFDGHRLAGAEAHGKHLLVHIAGVPDAVHLHLGMVGRVSVRRLRGRALGPDGFPRTDPPAPRGLRWRLLTGEFVADVIAPTICEILDPQGVAALHARLGPDPLRDDADPDAFVGTVLRSRRAIGQLLLDQSVLAGVGNVYRAEILFRLRLSPFRPGNTFTADEVRRIWTEASALLELGLAAGWIVTDDGQIEAARRVLGEGRSVPRWPKVYAVYGRAGHRCRVCGSRIEAQPMGQQRIFWCPRCQPWSA